MCASCSIIPTRAKEISNELGFPNLSFFGKYVKRMLGMSPKAYRKSLGVIAGE